MENKTIEFEESGKRLKADCIWLKEDQLYGVDMTSIGNWNFGPKTIAIMLVALNNLNSEKRCQW